MTAPLPHNLVIPSWTMGQGAGGALERAMNELEIRRRAAAWAKAGCIFIHVPKAAGTSVSHALYGQALGHFRAMDIRRVRPDLWAQCLSFGIVRDPLERLVSAYRFARSGGGEDMRISWPHRYRRREFEDFESFVRDWLVHQDLTRVDHVFRPQCHYVLDHRGVPMVDRLFPLTQMDQALETASRAVGRRLPQLYRNRTRSGTGRFRPAPGVLALIRRLYRSDFELHAKVVRHASEIGRPVSRRLGQIRVR